MVSVDIDLFEARNTENQTITERHSAAVRSHVSRCQSIWYVRWKLLRHYATSLLVEQRAWENRLYELKRARNARKMRWQAQTEEERGKWNEVYLSNKYPDLSKD